jgi:putative oxidoreductase
VKNTVDLIGRVFLAFIFFYEAYDTIFFFDKTKEKMDLYGLTWNQDILLYAAVWFLILGGIMVLIGYRASLGAFLLLLYWVPITFIVHDFWNIPDECTLTVSCTPIGVSGEDVYRRLQGILFMKNLAIIGALLMLWVNGAGKYSVKRLFATTKVPGA